MVTAEEELYLRAARLARMAPTDWEQFVVAFRAYSQSLATVYLNQSHLEELPRSQGRAQIAAHLTDAFADVLRRAAKIEERKSNG